MDKKEIVITSSIRTAVGSFGKSLKNIIDNNQTENLNDNSGLLLNRKNIEVYFQNSNIDVNNFNLFCLFKHSSQKQKWSIIFLSMKTRIYLAWDS